MRECVEEWLRGVATLQPFGTSMMARATVHTQGAVQRLVTERPRFKVPTFRQQVQQLSLWARDQDWSNVVRVEATRGERWLQVEVVRRLD